MLALRRAIFFAVFFTAFHLSVRAEPPTLGDIPRSEAERGNAFVESWLVLRNELDSISHMDIHPAIIDEWFESMPEFLARDVSRLATEPEVIAAAAKRLKKPDGETKPNNKGRQLLKRVFPHHYRVFLFREESARYLNVEDGLYDTWIQVMADAVLQGARTSQGMKAYIKSEIQNPGSEGDPETMRRRLVALRDFWDQLDIRISSTSEHPTWPADFGEALKAIRAPTDKKGNLSVGERRISAAISLLTTLGRSLGYDKLDFDLKNPTVLTPGAGRAFDGNLATSWYVKKGDTLVLLNETGRIPKGLHVSNFCPSKKTPRIIAIRITGKYDNETWSKTAKLKLDTHYFQYIPLNGKRAERLEIEIVKIQGGAPSCIAEIRLD